MKTVLFRSGALAIAVFFGATGAAQAECMAFPKISWWGNLTHDKVVRYVERKHDGNWAPYVKKWERQLAKIKGIHGRNSGIIIPKKGYRLSGKPLGRYIEKLETRVAVNRCLAMQATEAASLRTRGSGGNGS